MELCENPFPKEDYWRLGTLLAKIVTLHEIREHGESECKKARIEVVGFVAHCLKVNPRELDEVREWIRKHLAEGCTCGDNRELQT